MDNTKEGSFNIIKITKIQDLINGQVSKLPESDLTIQSNSHVVQLEYVEAEDEDNKYEIKPGCFSINETAMGTILEKFELKEGRLLETIDNTSRIIKEQESFFNRLHVYKELKREPKRSILLCSPPGVGKSAAITRVCKKLLEEEGTAVVVWDTSAITASSVNKFFLSRSIFTPEVKKLIMVIEDIEGRTSEEEYGSRSSNSSLLNFLDGVGNPFKGIPTFIIATTNNPERSVSALIDRPGRFDKVIEMATPNSFECAELLKFITNKDDLSDEEYSAMELAAKHEFSIAHIQESVVRSKLDDITIYEAVQALVQHKKRFKEAFTKAPKERLGLGM